MRTLLNLAPNGQNIWVCSPFYSNNFRSGTVWFGTCVAWQTNTKTRFSRGCGDTFSFLKMSSAARVFISARQRQISESYHKEKQMRLLKISVVSSHCPSFIRVEVARSRWRKRWPGTHFTDRSPGTRKKRVSVPVTLSGSVTIFIFDRKYFHTLFVTTKKRAIPSPQKNWRRSFVNLRSIREFRQTPDALARNRDWMM